MATKVKVELSKGEGEFANIELSGQTNYTYGNGENEFSVGLHGSNIHMLTVYKKTPGTVKITPLDGMSMFQWIVARIRSYQRARV